jgi:hypothetical protein
VPAQQLGRPLRIVAEEEVVHRVRDPVLPAGQVRVDVRREASAV